MKITNVDNTGIASMAVAAIEDEKGLQVIGATIMEQDNILNFPLQFPTETESHTCEFDENEKVARRKFANGTIVKVDFPIMQQQRNKRLEQGRKIENIEEYKASKKPAKVSGMEIGE